MKTIRMVMLATMLLMLVISCTTWREVKEPPVIGAEGVARPEWVLSVPKSPQILYETGYAKLSTKTTSSKRAVAEAKEKMAQWVDTKVESVVTNYTSDSGDATQRQALEAFESISRQVSQVSLSQVTQEGMWVDVEGGVWVLLSMPKEQAVQAFASAQDAFIPSDAAAFAQYKKDEALAMLSEILKEL